MTDKDSKLGQNTDELLEEDGLEELSVLKETAPENLYERLDRRITTVQLGKDLVEKQVFAIWTVIDAFLRLFLSPLDKKLESEEKGEE